MQNKTFASLFFLFLAVAAFPVSAFTLDIDLKGEPSMGPADAPVTIVMFYDFQCRHCARTAPVLLEVLPAYGNLARFVPVNFPSPGNAYAEPAAEFALTAQEKGKFWTAFPRLFADQAKISPDYLVALGKELGLPEKLVSDNLKNHAHLEIIKRDFYRALDLGLNATPTIFINDEKVVGYQTADAFRYYINAELEKKGIKSPVGPVAKPEQEKTANIKQVPSNMIFAVKPLPPTDSKLRVAVGQKAPDFTLPTIDGGQVRLSDYLGKKNVVLSFVPAAWTPVCSGQWPEYNEFLPFFEEHNTALIGISVDNLPSLYAWSASMGDLRFPVASDFHPHGKVADLYGVLRSNGTAERAVFVIDKTGTIRYIDVHDINSRPDFEALKKQLKLLAK